MTPISSYVLHQVWSDCVCTAKCLKCLQELQLLRLSTLCWGLIQLTVVVGCFQTRSRGLGWWMTLSGLFLRQCEMPCRVFPHIFLIAKSVTSVCYSRCSFNTHHFVSACTGHAESTAAELDRWDVLNFFQMLWNVIKKIQYLCFAL